MLRVVVRLQDGAILTGYTTAFDPEDRSLWLSPAPASPAGTMVALDRIELIVLERRDGRPFVLPGAAVAEEPSVAVAISFPSGHRVLARHKAEHDGGIWIEPAGRPFSRAFVPASASATLELGATAAPSGSDDGWSFLVHPSGLFAPLESLDNTAPTRPAGPLVAPPAPPSAASDRSSISNDTTAPLEIVDANKTQPDLRQPDFDD